MIKIIYKSTKDSIIENNFNVPKEFTEDIISIIQKEISLLKPKIVKKQKNIIMIK
jgi:hypothetical protein